MNQLETFRSNVPFSTAKSQIEDGDLLLYRCTKLIAVAGRGDYSHAAKVTWWDNDLFCLEVREFLGGRAVMLESQVEKYPGKIDVFESNPDGQWPGYSRRGAIRYMRRLTGCRYGWFNVIWAGISHLPFLRWFIKPQKDDALETNRPPFCSQAVTMADRIGGDVDPVEFLSDRLTEPNDLARSPFYRYRFTLVPDHYQPNLPD